MENIEEIAEEELFRDYIKTREGHNDWEVYSNKEYSLIVRKQYNTKYYSVGGVYKNKNI